MGLGAPPAEAQSCVFAFPGLDLGCEALIEASSPLIRIQAAAAAAAAAAAPHPQE